MGNGPEFFQTVMGHRFFERDVPKIVDALGSLADSARTIGAEMQLRRQERTEQAAHATARAGADGDALDEIADVLRGAHSDASAIVGDIAEIIRSTGRK